MAHPEATAGDAGIAERPSDEAIIEQENAIIRETTASIKPLGDEEPIDALLREYEAGGSVFQEKIHQISALYSSIRRARRDGNCFFRGFLFCYLESLQRMSPEEQQAAHALVSSWHQKLVDGGFQELVFEDALELVQELMQAASGEDKISAYELILRLSDENVSNYCIMLLRMFTSCEIQRRAEFFEPFVIGLSEEPITVEQFCRKHVEAMGEESDHLHIIAIADAMQTPLRIVYLDNAVGVDGAAVLNHHDFLPDGCSRKEPAFVMLYRPGHYDVLHTR
jgi:ubiquitin thioesterase protein OTUB1